MDTFSNYDEILVAVKGLMMRAIVFKATVYRACEPSYANTRDLISGLGSKRKGGRWNMPKGFAIVYAATCAEGALAETLGLFSHYGFREEVLPLTLVALQANLKKVIDLTDPKNRKALGITITAMAADDWRKENYHGRESLTQALGRACYEAGAEGMIVPSAAQRKYKNLNVFPGNLSDGGLKILGQEKLLPPGSS